MPIRFRFSWMPFIATVIAVTIGIMLGQWQTRRAQEKEAIERVLTARAAEPAININKMSGYTVQDIEYRQVIARGEFVKNWPIYLDNRPHQGQPGFYLLMPFKLEGSNKAVLIARGWIPRDVKDRTKIPAVATPVGVTEVTGMVRSHAGRLFQFGTAPALKPGAIVQNAEIAEVATVAGLDMLPFLIEQTNQTGDGLTHDWPRPSTGSDKHRGYAFQWYGLAVTALLFFLVTGFRRGAR